MLAVVLASRRIRAASGSAYLAGGAGAADASDMVVWWCGGVAGHRGTGGALSYSARVKVKVNVVSRFTRRPDALFRQVVIQEGNQWLPLCVGSASPLKQNNKQQVGQVNSG